MFRKDLIDLLLERERTVEDIARLLGERPGDVADDLEHLLKSLKHTPYQYTVQPATCRKCSFSFRAGKLKKPSKCPRCHGTWIQAARVCIHAQTR